MFTRLLCLSLTLLVFSAYTTIAPQNDDFDDAIVLSAPLPDYMTSLSPECFSISQATSWRPGVDDYELSDHILNHLSLYRNGVLLSDTTTSFENGRYEVAVALIRIAVRDKNDEIVGYHGGAISVCLFSHLIADDWTEFRLEIVDLDGNLLSFDWYVVRPSF
jgi:hypothetical protein